MMLLHFLHVEIIKKTVRKNVDFGRYGSKCSNGMFMYKINQYLLFGLINIVRIFNIQHINRTDGTLLKRAKEVPVTELFIVCISSRGMLRIPSTSCPTTVIPPSIVTMICFCSILSIFCSSSNIM